MVGSKASAWAAVADVLGWSVLRLLRILEFGGYLAIRGACNLFGLGIMEFDSMHFEGGTECLGFYPTG